MQVRGFSLAGHLCMKTVGGGALSLLRSRKQYYFAIDEMSSQLVYYKDESDLVAKREPIGTLSLTNAAFTVAEESERIFVLHSGEKVVELEAPNRESCECWLEALSHRVVKSHLRNKSQFKSLRRKRERSRSLPVKGSDGHSTNDYNLILPLSRRMYSCSASRISTDMALSVLEKKFSDPEPLARSQCSGIEVANSNRGPLEGNPIDWNLNEWVNNWLQHQKFSRNDEGSGSLDPSSSTSPYISAESSTTGSERNSNEELHHLRFISNQQKKQIHELIREKLALKEQTMLLRQRNIEGSSNTRIAVVSQNRFLNSEIIRLNRQCYEMQEEVSRLKDELQKARDTIERSRREYVFALQSAIRIPLHDNNALDVMHVKLLGGNMHKHRICQLMHEARNNQPCLPTLQSLLTGVYVDIFGFRHKYTDEGLAIHYMAMQLHEYYQSRLASHFEHKRKWKHFLTVNETIPLTRETRALVRGGIPGSLRATVWRFLIHQKVSDKKELYGRHYFRNLCSLQGGERDSMFCVNHQKQINLDLLRTMPNNVHFMSANCKGVSQLQQVLRAFCLHNTTLGYCQGMNFLASTALLFIGPEDTFWFLVAMTEHFHDKSYFDDNLAGAQADQEVLKELLEVKFPLISAHLNSLDIDLATITLNWFLALFFDAIPFNTMLRIWDCFLLEGPKVLFRFSLALLGQHQDEILARTDTIGIMKVIKAAVRLSYDADGLFKLAFDELGELPSQSVLRSKQLGYLNQLNQKLSQRQRLRSFHISNGGGHTDGCDLSISDLFFSHYDASLCFLIAGNQSQGIIGVIRINDGKVNMTVMDTEFDCRVCSFVLIREDMAFAGLISGYIIALHLQADECSILWELKLPDAPLQLHTTDGRLFAALANGTLTVLENIGEWSPSCLELFHIPLAPAPLIYVVSDGGDICIATACKLVRIGASTLSTLSTTYVACSSAGGSTPFFDKISCLASSPLGIFLCTANSTLLQLWHRGDCQLLFDVAFDHRKRKASMSEEEVGFFVTSLVHFDSMLWAGTSDGYVIVYSINENASENAPKFNLKRYPSGRRLSPQGTCGIIHRNQTCYIPTDAEAKGEEIFSLAEGVGRPSRVSISIDRGKQQYTVFRKLQDCTKSCQESEHMEKHDHIWDGNKNVPIRRKSSSSCNPSSSSNSYATTATPQRTPIMNGPTSVFPEGGFEHEHVEKNAGKKMEDKVLATLRSPIESSSNISMEYDDLFEVYSDEDYNRNYAYHTRTIVPSSTKLGSESSCLCANPLRRKDLEFNDPLLLIVPESSTDQDDNATSNCEDGEASTSEDYQQISTSIGLSLVMKLKIADRPVKRMATTRIGGDDLLLTCAGSFAEDESLLLWRKEPVSGLWINDPVPAVHIEVFNQ